MNGRLFKKVRVGEALVQAGALTEDQLVQALVDQKRSGRRLGELLVEQGLISANAMVNALAACLGVRGCVLRPGLVDPEVMALIGEQEAERLKVVPMFLVRGVLTVAMAEPQSVPTVDRLRATTGHEIRPLLAIESNIVEYIRTHAHGSDDVKEFLAELVREEVEVVDDETIDSNEVTDLDRPSGDSPIVNLVNVALTNAVRQKASDIHIEPERNGTRIRYRIDGMLRDLMKPPIGMHAAIVSRVKVIGKMDIAEKRLPQEGRVRIVAEGRDIDLRVSSMPTLLGEKLVVRILDKMNLRVRLEDLGFRPDPMATFKRVLGESHGLVLVTGPTGSGKTTTLYSALDLLRSPELNIMTVEDPVEYQLDGVNQVGVSEPIGLSFSRVLRSTLRQDPDVIMIGEIRDEVTARVAVQAALTGHAVLATLHTNDSPGAVARLIDMGVETYLLSSALNGVVAQRLARTICDSCRTKYFPTEQVLRDAGVPSMAGRAFSRGAGCQTCHDSGFQGRAGIYEVMEVTADLRRMIHVNCATHELRAKLRENGFKTLRDEGVLLAIEGRTSLEESLRVTKMDDEHETPESPERDESDALPRTPDAGENTEAA